MKSRLNLIIIILALIPSDIISQTPKTVQFQKKAALVIGNGNYSSSILANPENDSRSMSEVLKKLGFVVYEYENLTQGQMKRAIDDFGDSLRNKEVGLFYYAGHGIQSKGYNYLIPVDARLNNEKQVEYDCVQADRILALMEGTGVKVNIVILDACRNNPFERSWTRSESGKGLAFMNAPKGTIIAYATSPGSTASDGSGRNGLYTSAILESILIPNITIIQMFQQVRSIVSSKSNDTQTPWESTSLTGDFYFNIKENENPENKVKNQSNLSNSGAVVDETDKIVDSRDQERYKFVKINSQIWMAENLRATTYNDGTPIPLIIDNNAWNGLKSPAYSWYNNDAAYYKEAYGALYNWYAVNTGKLCPTGWHIPSYGEWLVLINSLGGVNQAGIKMKETGTVHWLTPNESSNEESGFKALPGGYRKSIGKFVDVGNNGNWWSSNHDQENNIMSFILNSRNIKVETKYFDTRGYGFSVRCLKN